MVIDGIPSLNSINTIVNSWRSRSRLRVMLKCG